MISDGVSAVGFETRDKDNFETHSPILSCEGTSGSILSRTCRPESIRVSSDPATVHTMHFRLPPREPVSGSCSGSYDRAVSVYLNYTYPLHSERGLYLEVYRNNPREIYIFSYFRIQIWVENLAY